MKIIFFCLVISVAVFSSCSKKDESKPAPSACFTVDRDSTADPAHAFVFTGCSTNAASSSWSFGDGNNSSSASTTHAYGQAGVYTVLLTVDNGDGVTATTAKTITVGHYSVVKVIFYSVAEPLPMRFKLRDYNSLTLAYEFINSPFDMPDTITFPDSPVYDAPIDGTFTWYEEMDNAGAIQWGSSINLSFAQIGSTPQLKQDFGLSNGSDNALFTMYFKFVVR